MERPPRLAGRESEREPSVRLDFELRQRRELVAEGTSAWLSLQSVSAGTSDAGFDYGPLGGTRIVDCLVELVEVLQCLFYGAAIHQLSDVVIVERVDLRFFLVEQRERPGVGIGTGAVAAEQSPAHVGEIQYFSRNGVARVDRAGEIEIVCDRHHGAVILEEQLHVVETSD